MDYLGIATLEMRIVMPVQAPGSGASTAVLTSVISVWTAASAS